LATIYIAYKGIDEVTIQWKKTTCSYCGLGCGL